MSSVSDIEAVSLVLRTATTFEAIFGAVPGVDVLERKRELRKSFSYLARQVHPDVAPAHAAALAGEVFQRLNELWKSAEAALDNGVYATPFRVGAAPTASRAAVNDGGILQSASATYRLEHTPYHSGDFSVLYRATQITGASGPVLIKLSADPTFNPLFDHELMILKRFEKFPKLLPYLPPIRDAFSVVDGGRRYRAIVMTPYDGMLSLADIRTRLSRSLEPNEVAWVGRRVIAQAIAARMIHAIHGAITPDHVLVHPITREPQHIGWLHAVDRDSGDRITMMIDRWKDWYPPEVIDKKSPSHHTDLFMVGKTLIWLLGGDTQRNTVPRSTPAAMADCIIRCVNEDSQKRPTDGRDLLDEFTRIVRTEWKREYRPMVVPDSSAGS